MYTVLQMKELHLGAVTMNDQGGWHVFKVVPEWICVGVPAGRRLRKEQAKCQSAGHRLSC